MTLSNHERIRFDAEARAMSLAELIDRCNEIIARDNKPGTPARERDKAEYSVFSLRLEPLAKAPQPARAGKTYR